MTATALNVVSSQQEIHTAMRLTEPDVPLKEAVSGPSEPHRSGSQEKDNYKVLIWIEGELVAISPEWLEYLQLESELRGISVSEVYIEERDAEIEIEHIAPSTSKLSELSCRPKRPAKYWQNGDEESPF